MHPPKLSSHTFNHLIQKHKYKHIVWFIKIVYGIKLCNNYNLIIISLTAIWFLTRLYYSQYAKHTAYKPNVFLNLLPPNFFSNWVDWSMATTWNVLANGKRLPPDIYPHNTRGVTCKGFVLALWLQNSIIHLLSWFLLTILPVPIPIC